MKTFSRSDIFKIIGATLILLVTILIAINLLYIKTLCSTRQCVVLNISTIALLIWASAFWLVVWSYSKKDKE